MLFLENIKLFNHITVHECKRQTERINMAISRYTL